MNCEDLHRIVADPGLDDRFDRDEGARHLGSCAACRRRHPELMLLLGAAVAAARPRPRPLRRGGLAAAALVGAAAIVGLLRFAGPESRTSPTPDARRASSWSEGGSARAFLPAVTRAVETRNERTPRGGVTVRIEDTRRQARGTLRGRRDGERR